MPTINSNGVITVTKKVEYLYLISRSKNANNIMLIAIFTSGFATKIGTHNNVMNKIL